MFSKIFIITFFFYGFLVKAQSSINEKVNKNVTSMVSLNQKFSTKVLNVYQDNSKTKIEDVFSYFQMLTDANLSDELKKEVVKNINLVFQNPNELVIDFTSESFDKIPLQHFIEKLLISEPILFSVAKEIKYRDLDYQSWKTNYMVSRTKSGVVTKKNIAQKVYFYETPKSFGTEIKMVFVTFLGAME